MNAWQIADALAQDQATVELLLASKSMQDLIAEYQQDGLNDAKALLRRTQTAASAGIAELHKRLENPRDLEFSEVREATFGLLDRAGVGPTSKHHVVSTGVSRDDLIAIITSQRDRVIDIHEVGQGTELPAIANDQAAEEGNLVREQAS
jgi:hypothetical protein